MPVPDKSVMRQKIRVLIVEDDLVDRMACRRAFQKFSEADFDLIEASNGLDGMVSIREQVPDCVLLDFHLPDLNGLEFLAELAGETGRVPVPVMLLTGLDSAETATAALKRGARDYLVKDVDGKYLAALPAAILRMLREQALEEAKRQAEAKFRSLVEQIDAITYMVSLDGDKQLLYVSPQIAMIGFSPQEWMSEPDMLASRIHPDDRAMALDAIETSLATGRPLRQEYRLQTRSGDVIWVRDQAKTVVDESGRKLFLQGLLIDITRSKLDEQSLRNSREELRQLGGHLERLKEAERKRIAQEIHDELGGLLTGIKAYVSVYLDRIARAGGVRDKLLVDALALADTGFQAVRRVITDLRPSVLDQLGVWAALEWYAGQIEARSGLQCSCTISANAAAVSPGPEHSTMLFRIVQEALTNAARHSQAKKISVFAEIADTHLVIEVRDDGKGMQNDNQGGGESWGLVGMNERARYFGGELTIDGKPGKGTTVILRLPMEKINGE
jgi:two-component system sensor histidine kinase UhpB